MEKKTKLRMLFLFTGFLMSIGGLNFVYAGNENTEKIKIHNDLAAFIASSGSTGTKPDVQENIEKLNVDVCRERVPHKAWSLVNAQSDQNYSLEIEAPRFFVPSLLAAIWGSSPITAALFKIMTLPTAGVKFRYKESFYCPWKECYVANIVGDNKPILDFIINCGERNWKKALDIFEYKSPSFFEIEITPKK